MGRRFLTGVVVAVAGLTMADPTAAADPDGNFVIKGFGFEPCKRYLAAKENAAPEYLIFRAWTNGFLTAYNFLAAETYDIAAIHSIEVLAEWLDQICRRDESLTFGAAVASLAVALQPTRLARKGAVVEARVGERVATIPEDLLRQAQRRLAGLDIYKGPVDGLFGPNTQAALETYQKAEGLKVTGLPDWPTITKLLQ